MCGRHFRVTLLATSLAIGASCAATAQQVQGQSSSRPAYNSQPVPFPGNRTVTPAPAPSQQSAAPQRSPSAPAQVASQPAPAEPRRPQPLASSAASAQAAAACMNEEKSASVDTAI